MEKPKNEVFNDYLFYKISALNVFKIFLRNVTLTFHVKLNERYLFNIQYFYIKGIETLIA